MTIYVLTVVAWDEEEEQYFFLSCSPRRQPLTANDIIAARRYYNLFENRGLSVITTTVSVPKDYMITMMHAGIESVINLTHDLNLCTLRAVRDYLSEPDNYQSQEY